MIPNYIFYYVSFIDVTNIFHYLKIISYLNK